MKLSSPELFTGEHDVSGFDCGEAVLNQWLRKTALKNQQSRASRTFVVYHEKEVLGYYALASGAVQQQMATGNVRRNMPDPIPVIVLGRLAVDKRLQGRRIGSALLQDAVARARLVSEHIGARALLVHALHESARDFYRHYGFQSSPLDTMTLMIRL